MIRSKSWRTSCRNPRVCRAAPRSSGHGSSRPGSAWPSSSSLMIRSCSGPESSFGGRGSGRIPSALARRIRSKAYDAQVRAGVVLRLRSSRAVKRSRSVSAASRPGARMSIRSGIDAVPQRAPDGGFDEDGRFAGARRSGDQDGAGAVRDVDGGELVRRQHRDRAVQPARGSRRSAEPEARGLAGRRPLAGRLAAGCAGAGLCLGVDVGWRDCGAVAGDTHTVISSSGTDNLCNARSSRSAMASIRSKSASVGAQRAAIRSTRQRPSPVRRKSA